MFHVVGVAGCDGFPGVAGRVGGGLAEGGQEPVLAVGPVVGERLAGPFAGDQDPAAGVAEVFAAVGFAFARAGGQAGPGVLGLDAVAEPVGAPRRARLEPQRLGEPVNVGTLGVAGGLVAVGHLLGEVFGQVADAACGVLGSGEHALGVEPVPEPGHMQRLVLISDGIQRVVPGRQDLPGRRVEVGGRLVVPDRQLVAVEPDDGGVGPPHLVVGRGEDAAQVGPGDGAAHGQVDMRREPPLRLDSGEVLQVVAEEAAQVLDEPVEQRREVQRVPGRPLVVVACPGRPGCRPRGPGRSWGR